ncbi:uncharacterized protein EV420DRAFT_1486070 [Desarmillaria tabescens]|uniref:Uncharacterized protein n=1 Tax=Armillaria tabescens TaxID=1929756 RepID=A0AA39JCG0_ARMTA|nr:uncharacterized protein EV420DRAFT_1486070 [Desarmillaria tabescens]KAK0440048.1 hypothetical protein EV420DRAFT_1486070 [Desarmillaria tabescens]
MPISCATLQRWTNDLNPGNWRDFSLRCAVVYAYGVMTSAIEPIGEVISPLSTDPISPGDYGWILSNGACAFLGIVHLGIMYSFKEMQHHIIESRNQYAKYSDPRTMVRYSLRLLSKIMLKKFQFDVPSTIKDQVRQRDQDCCLVTSNQSLGKTAVTWIVPPYYHRTVFPPTSLTEKSGLDREDLEVPSNAILLHQDLIPYFQDNAFSVDIDDKYRIILFREIGVARHLLPTHMAPHGVLDPQFEIVNLLDGDIREDYSVGTICNMMSELGVEGEDGDEMVPLSDPRRHTVLGQAIWEEVMRGRMAEAE